MLNECEIQTIDFDLISKIWKKNLWPDRTSPIKTHSSMTFKKSYDLSIYSYPATYWGIMYDGDLVGVNSGHRSQKTHYRSRGLYVFPKYRKQGIGVLLLQAAIDQAIYENCKFIWSIPRKSALSVYLSVGYQVEGSFFETETSASNIYVRKFLE